MRGWIFFPSSHEDLAPGEVRGWNIFPILSRKFGANMESEDGFFFPSSHEDLAPGRVREWKFFFHPLMQIWRQVEIRTILKATSHK
jgi:hypothetical protein